ncbi:NAD(P)-dependent oxidoreductase [Saccharopolyspora erythraea]|uniref:NAD(P)-dependent oxidoreductase n=1 Tax=Saccharopolyspora erythraea TaxID=1836 RepID=UPI001BA46356|nr:NAD(P)-dependent oxidoreductase [Saccharopolyspora erythraea]QUH00578.1 NAD(P)-dependent oxidoreductase [Saccharopolyspora erythraea]
MSTPVGVIGLGPMGANLALRMAEAGLDVVATSRSHSTREAAAQQGIRVVDDVRALAGRLRSAGPKPVVVVSLPSGPQVRAAVVDGLLADGGEFVVIDTSTCAPADARSLAEDLHARGCAVVDAPVSGGPTAARAGSLSVMVGGTEADVAATDEVIGAFAGRVVVCGGPGAGQIAKACNQLVVTAGIAVVAEALVTASALGADPAAVREALLGGYAASRILELHGDRMLRRDFTLGAAARTQLKDIGIIRELTEGVVDNQVFEAAARAMEELVESGGGDLDHSAAVQIVERRAGHSLG